MKNLKKGFTLIELIVVLLIISISSSVVILNVKRSNSINDKKFTAYFVRLLNKARIESIVNDKKTIVIINPTDRTIFISNSKKDSIKIPEEITLTAEKIIEEEDKYYIYFFSNGSSSGMDLNIYSKNFSKKILVNEITGFVKVMDILL